MSQEYGLDEYERHEMRRQVRPVTGPEQLPEGAVTRRRLLHPSSWQSAPDAWTPGVHTKVTLPAVLACTGTFRWLTVGGPWWLLLVPVVLAAQAVHGLRQWRSAPHSDDTTSSHSAVSRLLGNVYLWRRKRDRT